ncbi:MAG: RES domain-containing protein [Nocardioides sp.]
MAHPPGRGSLPAALGRAAHLGAAGLRWEPQPPPPADHPGNGVLYAATDTTTAFAEVFQARRALTLSPARLLSGWQPTRPLRLLDLTGGWAIRQGASASLHAAPRSTCRAWARAIRAELPDLDGLYPPSTWTLRPMVVLFAPAGSAFPAGPSFSREIDDPLLSRYVVTAADELGWPIRRA